MAAPGRLRLYKDPVVRAPDDLASLFLPATVGTIGPVSQQIRRRISFSLSER